MPGDYDGNGAVETSDYIVWRKGFGTVYTLADYDVWRAHFGQLLPGSGSGTNAAVPEPASAGLLLTWLVALVRSRRGQEF